MRAKETLRSRRSTSKTDTRPLLVVTRLEARPKRKQGHHRCLEGRSVFTGMYRCLGRDGRGVRTPTHGTRVAEVSTVSVLGGVGIVHTGPCRGRQVKKGRVSRVRPSRW